jgi:hypothetical protein
MRKEIQLPNTLRVSSVFLSCVASEVFSARHRQLCEPLAVARVRSPWLACEATWDLLVFASTSLFSSMLLSHTVRSCRGQARSCVCDVRECQGAMQAKSFRPIREVLAAIPTSERARCFRSSGTSTALEKEAMGEFGLRNHRNRKDKGKTVVETGQFGCDCLSTRLLGLYAQSTTESTVCSIAMCEV